MSYRTHRSRVECDLRKALGAGLPAWLHGYLRVNLDFSWLKFTQSQELGPTTKSGMARHHDALMYLFMVERLLRSYRLSLTAYKTEGEASEPTTNTHAL